MCESIGILRKKNANSSIELSAAASSLSRFSSRALLSWQRRLHRALAEDRRVLLNAFLSYAFKPHADWLAVEITGTPLTVTRWSARVSGNGIVESFLGSGLNR